MFKLNWTFSSFFCSQKSYNFFGSNLLFPNPTIWTKFSSTQLSQSKPLKEYLITKFVFQYTILSCGLYSHSHNFRLNAKIMWLYSHSYTFVLASLRLYNPDNSETYPESTMLRFRANMSPPNNQRALRKHAKSGKYSHSDKSLKTLWNLVDLNIRVFSQVHHLALAKNNRLPPHQLRNNNPLPPSIQISVSFSACKISLTT